ncbi:MAG: winged helix-turn-helix transcriptional regulator [Flavobacteriaceae bacterium]
MSRRAIYLLIAIVIIILTTRFFMNSNENTDDFSKRIKVSLREVGNQLLLSNGDSTSLILPIQKLDNSQYELSFQSHLLFLPDSLVTIVKRNIEKSELSQNYLVEVIQCTDKEVAYSYEMNIDDEKTIIPCISRVLPLRCYTIQVQFLDKKVGFINNQWLLYLFIFTIFFVLELVLYKTKSTSKQKEKNSKYTSIGSFQFYPEQNKLIKEAQEIALSNKERELLEIFVANANQVVKREDLTKRVWEDNGVFVGRSLDTYISKLRKKLQDDDAIKITNVHSVGYKLEITP